MDCSAGGIFQQERPVSEDFYEARIKELCAQNDLLRETIVQNNEKIREAIGLLHGVSVGDHVKYKGTTFVVNYIDITFGNTRRSKPWLRGNAIKVGGGISGASRNLYSDWEKVSP